MRAITSYSMLSFYTFRAVLVALPLALTTAAGQAVARPTGPHEGRPTPKKAVAAAKASPATRPAQLVAAVPIATPAAPAGGPAAPELVQLRGVVLNPDGRPCAGASVFPAGLPRQLVVTDAKGAFVLPVPAGVALSLQVEYFGVGSSRVAVDAPSAEPLRITLGK